VDGGSVRRRDLYLTIHNITIDRHPFSGGIPNRNLIKRAAKNAFFKTKTNLLLKQAQ
jgi:hypothetical protein